MLPLTCDAHVDPLWQLSGYAMLSTPNGPMVTKERMQFGGHDRVVLALYMSDSAQKQIGDVASWEAIKLQLAAAQNLYPDEFIALEGGRVLGQDPVTAILRLHELIQAGIRYVTLLHNADNQLGSSATDTRHTGLTRLGKEIVQECELHNVPVDISHADDRTAQEVMNCSKQPVIASHSGCYAVTRSPRNLVDYQIKNIALSGGIVCVPFARKFVGSIEGVAQHIDHICQMTGTTTRVGIGSDLDGALMVDGCRGAEDWSSVVLEPLIKRGYTDEQIQQVAGGNLLKFLKGLWILP